MRMHALQIIEPGKAEIVELPLPEPGEGEALLEIEAVATCPHWDRHIFEGRPMFEGMKLRYPYWPGQPGHEAIGRVQEIRGSNAKDLLGKRVAVWRDAGPYRTGMYATHGLAPVANLLVIPEELAAEKVASLELAMCVQVSVDQLTEINGVATRKVAVSGLGPAGLVAMQLLRVAGASEVWGIDPQPERRALAETLGADRVFQPDDSDIPTDRMAGDAFWSAIDTTGLPLPIESLMRGTRRAVAIFGVLRETVRFGPAQWYGGFSLFGYGEHNRPAADRALDAVRTGGLDLAPLITHRLPLSKYAEGVGRLQSLEAVKVLFDPNA